MDARTRDSTAPGTLEPKAERRNTRPLAYVKFRTNVEIPGVSLRVTSITSGKAFTLVEPETKAPQAFLDLDLRMVLIRERYYPLEVVESFTFARAAKKAD